jgi:hypothetical protein
VIEPRNDERRAEEARQLLTNPIYKEAYAQLEARWVNELAQQETAPDRAVLLRFLIMAGRKHRLYMEQVLVTGKMVELENERKRTLRDRMLRRA